MEDIGSLQHKSLGEDLPSHLLQDIQDLAVLSSKLEDSPPSSYHDSHIEVQQLEHQGNLSPEREVFRVAATSSPKITNRDLVSSQNEASRRSSGSKDDEVWELKKELFQLKTQMQVMKEGYDTEVKSLRDAVSKLLATQSKKDLKKKFARGSHEVTYYTGHSAGVYAVQYEDDLVMSASGDKTIRVWDARSKEVLHVLSGHTGGVCCLHYDKDRHRIVSGSWDKTIKIWDLHTGEHQTLKAHVNGVRCLQVKGQMMVSGASDKIIFVWNLAQSQCELILKGHEGGVYCLEFRGTTLVSGSADKTIRVWDLDSGKCLRVVKGHSGEVFCVKFNRNVLVSGSGDKTLRVWDLEAGECLKVMLHPEPVYACDLADNFLWSACGDPFLRMFDLKSGQCLRVLHAHSDGIYSIQLIQDKLLTGSIDKTIGLWKFVDDFNRL